MIKVCAKKIRETTDAYLLLFSFAHPRFERQQLKSIYVPHIEKFTWEIWLPKKNCKSLSLKYGFFCIDTECFDKIEKRIEINLNGKDKKYSFSTFKKMFTNITLSRDAQMVYNSYLQRTLDYESRYNSHPYDGAWTNWMH